MRKKLVIAIHTDYPWTEGMSYRVRNMARFLSQDYRVTIVAPVLEGSYPSGFEFAERHNIYRVNLKIIGKVKANRTLYRLLFIFLFTLSMIKIYRRLDPRRETKLVQVEQQLALLPGIVLSFLWGTPLIADDVLSPRRYYNEHSRLLKFLAHIFEMISLRRCRLIIGSSGDVVKAIHELYNFPLSRLYTIPNGFNSTASVDLRAALNEKSKDIVFMGSMYSKQNRRAVRNLIRIFHSISEEVGDARLVIIGGPLYLLREDIDSIYGRNLPNNILILGRISEADKIEYLTRACVYALPFDSTDRLIGGVRLKALEFLSYGKVVVSTSTGAEGIDGAVSGENMIITDDLESFKKNVVEVLKQPEKYEEIGKKAIKLASKYSWDSVLPRYRDIVKNIQVQNARAVA